VKRAIVVGSGAAGSTVARVLARSGQYTVLVLEKGRNYFTGLGGPTEKVGNLWANDELAYEVRTSPIAQDPLLEPRSYRLSPRDGKRTFVGDVNNLPTTVGGGTIHYDAKARRFREVDFITNSLMGGKQDKPAIPGTTYADWPMQYRHLEPFYAVMEEIAGIQGPAYGDSRGRIVNPNPNESWRSTPFPVPPGVGMYSSLILSDAAQRLGYHAAPVPTSIISRPYRGRPACNDCAHCGDFGCPTNAKGGGVWQLQDALQTGRVELRSECNVLRVEVDDRPGPRGRFRASGVSYVDAGGVVHTERGDLVVLANTPIEATRLSFLSGIGRVADESDLSRLKTTAEEPSGLLGRNLMYHLQTFAFGVVNEDIHPWRGRSNTHTFDDFAGAGPSPDRFDPAIPRGGIVELGGTTNPIVESQDLAAAFFGSTHKELIRLSPFRRHLVSLLLQGEDMPQLTNYVDLDPDIVDVFGQPVPRITYGNHAYELAAAAYYAPLLEAVTANVGGPGSPWPQLKTLFAAPIGNTIPAFIPGALQLFGGIISSIARTAHIMGTHRMALDHGDGPCNPYGRYWGFENLYHAGGGLFVTAPGFNPTLTIWALAYWVAAGILVGADQAGGYDNAAIDDNWRRQLEVIRTLDSDTMIARVLGGSSLGPPATATGVLGGLPSTSPAPGSGDVAAAAGLGVLAAAGLAGGAIAREQFQRDPPHAGQGAEGHVRNARGRGDASAIDLHPVASRVVAGCAPAPRKRYE